MHQRKKHSKSLIFSQENMNNFSLHAYLSLYLACVLWSDIIMCVSGGYGWQEGILYFYILHFYPLSSINDERKKGSIFRHFFFGSASIILSLMYGSILCTFHYLTAYVKKTRQYKVTRLIKKNTLIKWKAYTTTTFGK